MCERVSSSPIWPLSFVAEVIAWQRQVGGRQQESDPRSAFQQQPTNVTRQCISKACVFFPLCHNLTAPMRFPLLVPLAPCNPLPASLPISLFLSLPTPPSPYPSPPPPPSLQALLRKASALQRSRLQLRASQSRAEAQLQALQGEEARERRGREEEDRGAAERRAAMRSEAQEVTSEMVKVRPRGERLVPPAGWFLGVSFRGRWQRGSGGGGKEWWSIVVLILAVRNCWKCTTSLL